MKKTIVLLFALGWLITNGQRQPILPYGHYSPRQVKNFANGDSPKAKKVSAYLLLKTGESSINSLFQKVVVKDTILEAGTYENSYWDVPTQELKFFPGKRFEGEITLYQNKIFETILYKDTCVNILNTQRKYFGLIEEDQPVPVPAVNHDWRYFRGTVSSTPPPPPPPPVIEIKHSKLYYFNKNYPLVKWIAGVGFAYGTYRIIENQGGSSEPIVVIPPPKKDGSPVDAQPQGRVQNPFIGFRANINF
ncbi:MAG: hypothetical protein WCW54_01550 [Candidatus Paceibacterota bacterium]